MSNQHTYTVPFTEAQLRRDYKSGMTQTEIAAKYKTTQKVIWHAMKKMGIKARIAVKRDQTGDKNSSWKGDAASYSAMHARMTRQFGQPKRCDECGTTDKRKSYDWSNVSGRFGDVTDYRRLCRSCHWKLDGKVFNIKRMRGRKVARG